MTSLNDRRVPPWSTAILATYWIALFTATHWPRPPRLIPPLTHADKAAHFLGFAGLAILLGYSWSRRRRFGRAAVVAVIVLLACYAAIDEWTQPLAGRDCNVFDWCADMLGVSFGLALLGAAGLIHPRRAPPSDPSDAPWQSP